MQEDLNNQATMWDDQVTTQEESINNTKGVKQQCTKKKWATMQEDPSNNVWTNTLVGSHYPQLSKQTLKINKVCLWGLIHNLSDQW
jgi:hypothetical protein